MKHAKPKLPKWADRLGDQRCLCGGYTAVADHMLLCVECGLALKSCTCPKPPRWYDAEVKPERAIDVVVERGR
jgi:hypothetical protein